MDLETQTQALWSQFDTDFTNLVQQTDTTNFNDTFQSFIYFSQNDMLTQKHYSALMKHIAAKPEVFDKFKST